MINPSTGKYYEMAADRFTVYALVELAGKEHTKFIDDLLYMSTSPDPAERRAEGC